MMALAADRWITIAFGLAIALIVALAGGMLTEVGPWYESLRFPSWRPPGWLFGPAWAVIFICIAASGILVWVEAQSEAQRHWFAGILAVNGLFNVLWSALFFRAQRPDWAFADLVLLWLSILCLVIAAFRTSQAAGWLMSPYLAWVTFAGALNFKIVQLNGPFQAEA